MQKRESSLIFKPLNSLETTSLESTLSNESSKKTFHKLPEWLIEYDSQQTEDDNLKDQSQQQKFEPPFCNFNRSGVTEDGKGNNQQGQQHQQQKHTEVYRVRPLTENSGLGRPLWFQELLQARRHSEVLLPSSFEEEDIVYRLNSIEMDQENSGGSSSDNVDIIMILDDDNSSPSSNESIGDRKELKEAKISPIFSSSSPTCRRSSLQLAPRETRKNRSLSQYFDFNDFKLSSEKQMFNNNNNNQNSKSMLLLNAEELNNKCNEDLFLTTINGLDSVVNHNYFDDFEPDEGTVFKRKDLGHRDSYTAADIDLVSLDEPEMETDFIIPELPEGRELTIEIKSNWGDEDYVGFNGIEIFDLKTKRQAIIEKISCDSAKTDVRKLIDGVYRTHDDEHIWVTDYSPLGVTKLTIKFQEKITIALIRFWNYNKSRIYSYRGIRYVTMSLDGVVIFRGEIAKAIGELVGPPERFGDTILFTTDETILEDVADNDLSFQELLNQNV